MPNLSLLSRGAGQVVRKTQEKLEVHFEPEDYLNWKTPERRYVTRSLDDSKVVEGSWGLDLPKTYSTKTGTLVLYSEDLAKPSRKLSKSQHRFRSKSRMLHVELHTLQDLVRAILAYGGKQARKDRKAASRPPYLHFLRSPSIQPDRQMRPGYSAKRYLLKLLRLAQIWDPNILQKLQRAGYIKDSFVLEESIPYHRRKQDLSAIPPKYKCLPIFCLPGSYLWDQMEKANPGLGLSSYTQSETEPWLVDGYKRGKCAKRKTQIAFRISIRKLNFHLSPQRSKQSTWGQKAKYRGTAEHPNESVRQELTDEDQGQIGTAKQSTACPPVEKILPDTSELWREKGHVTFYGGFFRGRKLSDSVSQHHPKNLSEREGGPSGFLPLIQPGTNSEQSGVRKPQRKPMPEIFRLPGIPEEQFQAHRGKLKSRELPKELTIFPLLVRLEREPHTIRKNSRADVSSSEADDCHKPLAPLSNVQFPKPEHRGKMCQMDSSEILETPECSFYLPPISSGEFAISRTKTRKRERAAETDNQRQRESIQDGVSTSGPLPAITSKKDPSDQDTRANFEPSISTNPVGIPNSVQQEKLGECYSSAPLSSLPKGPGREIVCPLPLGTTQATEDPEYFEFVPTEEADGTESLATKTEASRNQPETSFSAPELDKKVTPQTQEVEIVPETENSLPKEQSMMESGSTGAAAESREDIHPSQDGFRGNDLLTQRKQKKGHPALPKPQDPKQKKAQVPSERLQERSSKVKARLNSMPEAKTSRDSGKRMENLAQSESVSRSEPSLSQWVIPESEMDSDLELPGLSKELTMGMDMHSSESQVEAGEDNATLAEKLGLQTKITGHISAGDDFKNKLIDRPKKPELRKAGPKSKAQKKILKKDSRHSREEFVVGKPKQKKAIGKSSSFSKEKTGDVKNPEVPGQIEEEDEEEQKELDAEVERLVSDAEKDSRGRTLDKSPSSLSPIEEGPLPTEYAEPFPADFEHPSGSQTDRAQESPTATPPAVYTPVDSQIGGMPSGELHKILPETKGEEKLSRERIIAERAEKRRLAVEKKRREQEELKQKQREEQERMERMKEEMEEEKRRRLEEIRLRKQHLQEELQRQEEEAARKLEAEKTAQERFRQQQEELRRKLLEAQKKKEEEERDHEEAEKRRQKERETWLEEERRRLAEMAEEQRVEYEKQKREEEERARREAEERRKNAEEAAQLALEEARRQALLLARQMAEQKQKERFQHTLVVEASGLERQQDISRPWVYSYFQHPFLTVGDDC